MDNIGPMTTKEYFFFDAGYTLIYLDPDFEHLFVEIMDDFGHQISVIQAKSVLVRVNCDTSFKGITTLPDMSFWDDYSERILDIMGVEDVPVKELSREIHDQYNLPDNWAVYHDVVDTLEDLISSGCNLGVISNARKNLHNTLEHLRVSDYFDTIITSEEVGVEKPNPKIFEAALENANQSPEKCVHTGDKLEIDVKGAKNVGITPVWLDRQKLGKKGEAQKIHTLEDLLTMFPLPK